MDTQDEDVCVWVSGLPCGINRGIGSRATATGRVTSYMAFPCVPSHMASDVYVDDLGLRYAHGHRDRLGVSRRTMMRGTLSVFPVVRNARRHRIAPGQQRRESAMRLELFER